MKNNKSKSGGLNKSMSTNMKRVEFNCMVMNEEIEDLELFWWNGVEVSSEEEEEMIDEITDFVWDIDIMKPFINDEVQTNLGVTCGDNKINVWFDYSYIGGHSEQYKFTITINGNDWKVKEHPLVSTWGS